MTTAWIVLSHFEDEAATPIMVCKSKESAIAVLRKEFDKFVEDHYSSIDDEEEYKPSFLLETDSGTDIVVEFHESLIYTAQEVEVED